MAKAALTARIERAQFHRARSSSKKSTWPFPPNPSEAARCASTGDQQAPSHHSFTVIFISIGLRGLSNSSRSAGTILSSMSILRVRRKGRTSHARTPYPAYNTTFILLREVAMSVRLNITMDDDVYARLKKEVPPKKLSAFIAEAVRAKLHPDAKVLNTAHQAASKERWRTSLDADWKHIDNEGWPK